jgi:hypothetical protein
MHHARYLHERIQDVRMIKIVPAKALPRTAVKGNIRCVAQAPYRPRLSLTSSPRLRRRAVEHDFARDLEAMYASLPQEEIYASVLSPCISEPAPKGKDMSSSGRGPAKLVGAAAA